MKKILQITILLTSILTFSQEKLSGKYCSIPIGESDVTCIDFKQKNQFEYSVAGCLGTSHIGTVKGFCYLALITDMHSRKIVGYDLSDSLELSGCVRALNKAVYQAKNIKGLIHHSDRGIQYCSNVYTQILKRKKIGISMTEENHCYENAMAERVNGILKDEFYLDQTFINVAHAKKAAKNAIKLYNQIRLHLSLDFKTPNMVYNNAA